MRQTRKALIWILKVLSKYNIKHRISGGFAAKIYGSKRKLADIDIEIPEDKIIFLSKILKKFIIYGPKRYKDSNWKTDLLTINYAEQEIDLFGAYNSFIFNKNNKKWEKLRVNFPKRTLKEYKGIKINLIKKDDLISYKQKLQRRVDKKDISYLK